MNTIKDCCEAYVLEVSSRTHSSPHASKVRRFLADFTRMHGELAVEEFNDGHVMQWLDEHEWSPLTKNDALKTVKAALRSSGVSIRVRVPRLRAERQPRLIPLNIHQLLVRDANPDLVSVLDTIYYTGALASEVVNLDIKHVIDRPEGMFLIRPVDKWRSKLAIAVPTVLEDDVRRLVAERDELDPLFVHGDGSRWSYPKLRTAFRKHCHSCGVKDIVFRDYRRSFYMRLVEAGMDIHIIEALLGNAPQRDADHFDLSPRVLLDAVNRAAEVERLDS